MSIVSIVLLLFIVLDPFGNLVTLNTLLRNHEPPSRRRIMLRESAIALGILLVATFAGKTILDVLSLQGYALGIAGGIVLFMISLGMLFPAHRIVDEAALEDPLIVPIAMPLIAGPSAISMVILLAEKHTATMVAEAVTIASLFVAAILSVSPSIFAFLGRRGALAMERLMGMLLVMLSVQMILDGIGAYLQHVNSK
jgi:multiple antibiotic resistance protein